MKPFCGYNFGDYWTHWFKIGAALRNPPRIFHVNWFRQNAQGKFLWPGFGENLRVLSWILDRCAGRAGAVDTPIGQMPRASDLNTQGLDLSPEALAELTAVPQGPWLEEASDLRQYLQGFGDRLPPALLSELDELERRLR